MIEAIAADLVTKSVLGATIRLHRQFQTAAMRRRDGKPEMEAIDDLLSVRRAVDSKRFLGLNLPSKFSQERLNEFLLDATSSAVVFETISASLMGAQSFEVQKICERWQVESAPLLPEMSEEERLAFVKQVFTVLTEEANYITMSLESLHAEAFPRLREHARHNRLYAILEALEKRVSTYAPSEAETAVADQNWLRIYRSQAALAHGFLTPPDFVRRRSVPISDLYVSPTIASRTYQEKIDINTLSESIDRTVLLGDPGGGKTTAGTVILHKFATSTDNTVPFLVILREFASDGKTDKSVVEHIETRLKGKYQCEAPAGTVQRLLESGRAFLVFDGLDELLDTSLRRDVADAVTLFCNRFPLTKVLVTSRSVGYDQAALDPRTFSEWEITGFDDNRIREYTSKWFRQDESLDEKAAQEWSNAFVEESTEVADLRTNPLLLSLMCIIYRGEQSLPKNRPAVYEKCAMMLFEKWDSHRRIHTSLRVGPLVDPAMKYLAYWMITNQDASEGVTESRLVQETATYLKTQTFEDESDAVGAAREFVEFCRGRAWVFSDAGTTADGEPLYKFTHRTFMEYFAAYHLDRRNDSPEQLGRQIARRVANAEWDVIAQLAVQICDKHTDSGANRIFALILGEGVKRTPTNRANQLAFLARCLPFALVSPASVRDLTRQAVENALVQIVDEPMAPEKSALVPLLSSHIEPQILAYISDEFERVIGSHLCSGDRERQRSALFVLAGSWISCYFSISRGANKKYWRERSFAVLDTHRSLVLEFVTEEPILRYYAVVRGYGGIVDLYAEGGRNISTMFTPVADRFYAVSLWSPAQTLFDFWSGADGFIAHSAEDSRLSLSQLGVLIDEEASVEGLFENHQVGDFAELGSALLKNAIDRPEPRLDTLTKEEFDGYLLLFCIAFEVFESIAESDFLRKAIYRLSSSPRILSVLERRISVTLGMEKGNVGSQLTIGDLPAVIDRWANHGIPILRLSRTERKSISSRGSLAYFRSQMEKIKKLIEEEDS